jgi:hypothetical protein
MRGSKAAHRKRIRRWRTGLALAPRVNKHALSGKKSTLWP